MKIGIAGAGRLGSAVCERLLRQGLQVSLWNRTPGRTAQLEALGAVACGTPHELVQASDVVMTLLTDADALQAVYLGAQGLLSGDLAGKTFVEMSTVRPQVQRDLAAAVIKAGASFVECPVAGSKDAALSGTLIAIAAGEADDVARVRPVLEQLCKRIEHVGPVGSAASVKLAVNLPLIVYFQVLSEALTLIDHLHLDPHRVIGLLAESTGGPNFLRVRGGSLADALNGAELGPAHATVGVFAKDLQAMLAEAAAMGATLPVVQTALGEMQQVQAQHPGDIDGVRLPALLLERARVRMAER